MHYVGLCMASMALNITSDTGKVGASVATSAATRRRATAAYYERHAEDYASATMAINVSDSIARFATWLPSGARVLDAGCGAGRDLIALQAAGFRAEGLDISPSLAAIARKCSGLNVTIGDLRDPPFRHASFDGVWAMASLLHVEPGEVHGALVSLRNILVPGGIFFASVKRGAGQSRDTDGRWFTLHDEVSWGERLESAGFDTIEIIGEPPSAGNGTGSVRSGWVTSLARRPS